jgi:hypothetical protein
MALADRPHPPPTDATATDGDFKRIAISADGEWICISDASGKILAAQLDHYFRQFPFAVVRQPSHHSLSHSCVMRDSIVRQPHHVFMVAQNHPAAALVDYQATSAPPPSRYSLSVAASHSMFAAAGAGRGASDSVSAASGALPRGLHWLDDMSGVESAASTPGGAGWVSGWRSDNVGTGTSTPSSSHFTV